LRAPDAGGGEQSLGVGGVGFAPEKAYDGDPVLGAFEVKRIALDERLPTTRATAVPEDEKGEIVPWKQIARSEETGTADPREIERRGGPWQGRGCAEGRSA
jgi:hypothetical protein